jgi:cytochrome c
MRLIVLAAALVSLAAPALAAGDPAHGEAVFKKCMACHAVGDNAKNKVGPVLNGVIGRTAGTLEGYKYSQAMIDAGAAGTVWDEPTLTTYLTDPKALVKGTKMAFAGLKQPQDIADVIAYLETFTDAR